MGALAAASQLEANPAKYPRRTVLGKAVDLTPLMNWWTKHEGDRPLQAWVRVTGRVVGTNALGWTVEGTVEAPASGEKSDPQTNAPAKAPVRVVLKNPPLADLLEFQNLTAQLLLLNQERARLVSAVDEATNHVQELSARRVFGKMYSRMADEELSQWRAAAGSAKDRLNAMDDQLKELNARLADYPDRDQYQVDCFALKLGEQLRSVPVYDHGVVPQP
jgi:hypothetical protein